MMRRPGKNAKSFTPAAWLTWCEMVPHSFVPNLMRRYVRKIVSSITTQSAAICPDFWQGWKFKAQYEGGLENE